MADVNNVFSHIEATFEDSVARTLDLLRIPSISTDAAYDADVRRAADWLKQELTRLGFDAELRETEGHPVLMARHGADEPGAPTVLYYGHYDVQPADPLELWTSPPFDPQIVEGPHGRRFIARGAVDDKGQVMTFVEAFRAWKAVHGGFPVNIVVMLEGEEESGSPSLPAFLSAHAAEIGASDIAVITDTTSWDIDTPAITYRLRGLVYVEVTVTGPSRDLHSGKYGGAVVNPIHALSRAIAALHDEDGRVQIPGFYDDVEPLTDTERKAWADLNFDETSFLGEIGLKTSTGEAGTTVLERTWGRPCCDVNGIYGGYTGEGHKTVIASKATAKISCRLVPRQDPEKIIDGIRAFFREKLPSGCTFELTEFAGSPGFRVPESGPFLTAAKQGLEDVYKRPVAMVGGGGSIPVVGLLKEKAGLDSILVGFGLSDDRIHSPNEKFELKCFKNGILSHAAILARFSNVQR